MENPHPIQFQENDSMSDILENYLSIIPEFEEEFALPFYKMDLKTIFRHVFTFLRQALVIVSYNIAPAILMLMNFMFIADSKVWAIGPALDVVQSFYCSIFIPFYLATYELTSMESAKFHGAQSKRNC